MENERNYAAFISYRHLPLDREAAIRIQKRIERFVVPKEYRSRVGGKKLGLCFRDEDELPASASLSESIKYALDHSRFLIVICTPQLQLSQWCMAEIQYFLATHDRNHILAVLVDGRPDQAFPDMLRFIRDAYGNILANVEPLAANISTPEHKINNKAFKKESLRLCAALLGCPFDALWQREHRARTNRFLMAMGAGLAVMTVFVGVVLMKNAQISDKNQELEEKNTEITQKNRELEKEMSSALVDAGLLKLQNHDLKAALQSGLDALESGDPEIYDHRAQRLLNDALMAYSSGQYKCDLLMMQTTDIEEICTSADGELAFTADRVGNVLAVNVEDGTVLWEVFLNTSMAPQLYPIDNDRVLVKSPELLIALSMRDGSSLWSHEYDLANSFQAISDDGTRFAIMDRSLSAEDIAAQMTGEKEDDDSSMKKTYDMWLEVLDTATGERVCLFSVPDDPYHTYFNYLDPLYNYCGDFSDDNTCLAAIVPTVQNGEQGSLLLYARQDGQEYGISCLATYNYMADMILGVEISDDKEYVYWALADNKTLFSIVSDRKKSAEEAIVNEIDYTMSSMTGIATDYVNTRRPYLPMLTSDRLVVLTSRATVYIIERSSGVLYFHLTLESPAASVTWLDEKNDTLEILTEDGHIITYYLDYGSPEYFVSAFRTKSIPVTDICAAHRVYSLETAIPPYNDYFLTVSVGQPEYLLSVMEDQDPDYQACGFPSFMDCLFARPTPSGDRMMLFYLDEDDISNAIVRTFDIRTGTFCEEAQIRPMAMLPILGLFDAPIPTDDSHFLLYGHIYGLDGSDQDITNSSDDKLQNLAAVMPDGRLLYACRNFDIGGAIPYVWPYQMTAIVLNCYIDGQLVDFTQSLTDGLAFMYNENDSYKKYFAVGGNGWIAGWGNYLTGEEVLGATSSTDALYTPIASEQTMVVAQDVMTGKKVEFKDEMTGTPITHMVLSNQDPYMVCAYETGTVMVYDMKKERSHAVSTSYAPGEIQGICFSDHDQYFLVLTVNGRVDCYEVNASDPAASLMNCFDVPSDDYVDFIRAIEDTENHQLVLLAGNESGKTEYSFQVSKYWSTILDTDSWEITGQPEDICWWSVKHGQAVLVKAKEAGICKIHTLDDLIEWARSIVEGE